MPLAALLTGHSGALSALEMLIVKQELLSYHRNSRDMSINEVRTALTSVWGRQTGTEERTDKKF